ncbi:MAG: RHS repeat-associated core domain-containing protein, partial [Anaerolineales bacterium]|nr:RHS repeat-associated core domain-containing protein [Anaerolineales bacterium]
STPTATFTPSNTPTATATQTPTFTLTPTFTSTPTITPTPSVPVFSSATFTYDGDGRRVKSVLTNNIGSTTTYFVGTHYEVTNGIITKYYFAGSQRIAMRKNGVLNYILGDHLGSTSLVADANGAVINQTKYKAWGETRYSSGGKVTEYQYTGQYSYESDFGLYFYNARFYDPQLGRFSSPDSIIPEQTQGVQAWDRYAYTSNNSIRYTDPSGHCAIDAKADDCLKSDKSNA